MSLLLFCLRSVSRRAKAERVEMRVRQEFFLFEFGRRPLGGTPERQGQDRR